MQGKTRQQDYPEDAHDVDYDPHQILDHWQQSNKTEDCSTSCSTIIVQSVES